MYPINLDLTGQACLVLGGGSVAERKVRRLLDEGAVVTVIAPALTPALQILPKNINCPGKGGPISLAMKPPSSSSSAPPMTRPSAKPFQLLPKPRGNCSMSVTSRTCATSPYPPSSARATCSSPSPPTARRRPFRAGSGSTWNSTSTNAMAAGC